MTLFKSLLALCTAFCAVFSAVAEDPQIFWWPRITPAAMPNNLEQLAAWEFMPSIKNASEAVLTVTLPDGVVYKGQPTAWLNPDKPSVYAIPYPSLTAVPSKVKQEKNVLTMTFPPESFNHETQTWLPVVLDVQNAPEGLTNVKFVFSADGNEYTQEIPLQIWPQLSGEKNQKPLIIWNFQGLDEQFLPIYMNGLVQAGANRFYEMREETPRQKGVVDFQDKFDTIHGTAFFGERIGKYFEKNGLPAELAGRNDIVYDNAWLIDHPEVGEVFMREYIKFLMDGKEFKVVIYDAERGAFKSRGTKIVGDLTEYSLNKFGKQFNIPAADLTPEIITEKYKNEWVQYNCEQSRDLAKLANKVVKEQFPGCTFEVYSGYEYDQAPYVDLTRLTYAMSWKIMADCGMDAAGAGYFGSMDELRNTANALQGKVPMLPAEMQMEGFQTPGVPMPRLNIENFAFRLIEAYLNTGANGMQIWSGPTFYGSSLISLDIYTKFVNLTNQYLANTKEVSIKDLARLSPPAAINGAYAFQGDGQTVIILLNKQDNEQKLRLNFTNLSGSTMTEVTTGETTDLKKTNSLTLAPWSYKVLVIK